VLARYEPDGRGYYSGLVAAIGRDATGRRTLDSSILIRTVDIDTTGRARIPVGSTLVRHSDPLSEAAETVAKAAGVLAAVQHRGALRPAAGGLPRLGARDEVVRALRERNVRLSRFWFADPRRRAAVAPQLVGMRILVVDAEDMFTAMLGMQLSALGPQVTVRRFDEPYRVEDADLVLVGPGPGDPRDDRHPKIAALGRLVDRLLAEDRPFLAVCLGHQVLSRRLGLDLVRRPVPNQGVQREIDLFGTPRRVGFYNTFAALAPACGHRPTGLLASGMLACADPATGEVHALRGPGFWSMQFHPESVLTEDGIGILREALTSLLAVRTGRRQLVA
jgi:2-amino-4-deoxychorismate synthase